MVAVADAVQHADESQQSLAFGARAMCVKTHAVVNETLDVKVLTAELLAQLGGRDAAWYEQRASDVHVEALTGQLEVRDRLLGISPSDNVVPCRKHGPVMKPCCKPWPASGRQQRPGSRRCRSASHRPTMRRGRRSSRRPPADRPPRRRCTRQGRLRHGRRRLRLHGRPVQRRS